jgi:hypothetical protein
MCGLSLPLLVSALYSTRHSKILTKTGRKEITDFFYLYMLLTAFSLVIDAGVVPPGSGPFPWFVAVQNGLVSATCTCLLINGFVGFQLYEDGTNLSVWLLRASSVGMFVISFIVSLFTFKGWVGLDPANPVGLFVVIYVLNAICLAIYVVMQLLLVWNTLDDRWPLGHIALGVFFFVAGQVLVYAFSATICNKIQHYLDGLFFGTVCNLFAVMMIYKVPPPPPSPPWLEETKLTKGSSTGTLSQKKTLNSPSASNQTTGTSRTCTKKTAASPSIPTAAPNTHPAHTIAHRLLAVITPDSNSSRKFDGKRFFALYDGGVFCIYLPILRGLSAYGIFLLISIQTFTFVFEHFGVDSKAYAILLSFLPLHISLRYNNVSFFAFGCCTVPTTECQFLLMM